jgi:putative membrane protein
MKTLIRLAIAALFAISATLGAAQAQQRAPNDLEIAHIAFNAGLIDIRYAHLALAISENAAVREFAQTMIRDHTAVNERAVALLRRLNANPQDNATSQQLLQQAAQLRAELRALDGAAFDRRYAQNELAYHQFVNRAVETQFIPAVQNTELRELLRGALEIFKRHEQHAARMVEGLR